jgi:hypothetical protein
MRHQTVDAHGERQRGEQQVLERGAATDARQHRPYRAR